MSTLNVKLFTRKLLPANSPFVITKTDGINQYTLNLTVGSATITGSRKLNGLTSNAIDLVIGQPFSGSVPEGATITIVIAAASVVDFAAQ